LAPALLLLFANDYARHLTAGESHRQIFASKIEGFFDTLELLESFPQFAQPLLLRMTRKKRKEKRKKGEWYLIRLERKSLLFVHFVTTQADEMLCNTVLAFPSYSGVALPATIAGLVVVDGDLLFGVGVNDYCSAFYYYSSIYSPSVSPCRIGRSTRFLFRQCEMKVFARSPS